MTRLVPLFIDGEFRESQTADCRAPVAGPDSNSRAALRFTQSLSVQWAVLLTPARKGSQHQLCSRG